MHAHLNTHTHTHTHTQTRVCVCACWHTYTDTHCWHTYTDTQTHTHTEPHYSPWFLIPVVQLWVYLMSIIFVSCNVWMFYGPLKKHESVLDFSWSLRSRILQSESFEVFFGVQFVCLFIFRLNLVPKCTISEDILIKRHCPICFRPSAKILTCAVLC